MLYPSMNMDSIHKHLYQSNHASQALPPIEHQPQLHTSGSDFPILTVSILSVVITVFMLLCYYIFVSKCCINSRHHLNLLRRFSFSQAQRSSEGSLMSYSPTALLNRGLDESFIRDLPTSQFSRRGGEIGCVFCLSEFQDEDILRVLPKCSHAFHLDCIDVWLQSNSNCPLCRSSIIEGEASYPNDHIPAPSSSPQGSQPMGSFMDGDEDFVVIELRGEQGEAITTSRVQQQEDYSRDAKNQSRTFSPNTLFMKGKHCKSKLPNGSSMGDECLDARGRDDQFAVQPIRRSISLNSAAERQLFLSVQEALREKSKNDHREEACAASEGSCSSRIRRSFFPFGNGRGYRNAVLPIEF